MITLVLGRQGSGKTVYLTKVAYEAWRNGIPVYSNFKLKFPYQKITYEDVVNCNYTNAVCIIDEIHLLLSARRSLGKINRLICDGFLSMVRKKGLNLYGSTQTERKVDIRFREEADYIIYCQKYAYSAGAWSMVFRNENLPFTVPIMIKMDIQETYSNNVIESGFIGNPYFNLFDTTEIIPLKPVEELNKKLMNNKKV